MTADDLVVAYAKNFMLEIMAVLYFHGQNELHVGAVLRLMGVANDVAAKHDDERIVIDDELASRLSQYREHAQAGQSPVRPKNSTLH